MTKVKARKRIGIRCIVAPMDPYQAAASHADQIESELRALNVWQAEPPLPSAFQSKRAFFADTMSFYQWLQWVLLARVRDIIATRGSFPSSSSVGAYAVRELDGCDEASELIHTLSEFDQFIEGLS
jgi:uncharacterized protein YqcC (DUF446 family)